jgi:predicted nucleic acid-binding protein
MNGGKVFFDTNVLLYMHGDDPDKRSRAEGLFQEYAQAKRALVSTQVVQEFHAAGSRKLRMTRDELKAITIRLLDLTLIVLDAPQIKAAIQLEERYQISFWDALILAAAESGGAEVLYTEDLNDGQQYGAVVVRNPFRSRASA